MKKMLSFAVLAMACFVVAGMASAAEDISSNAKVDTVTLCGDCGQIKGAEVCCKKDAEACAGCELHKGSPGCCKIEKGKDVALCAKCGQVKGSDVCCKKDAEVCSKCSLHKGAPGCCKMPLACPAGSPEKDAPKACPAGS